MTSKKPDPDWSPTSRPLTDPQTDSLTAFSDADRAAAMDRFRVLQPHLQIGVPLTEVADASRQSVRTLRRWAAKYREAGLAGLVRRGRADAGRRKLQADLAQQIEALVGSFDPPAHRGGGKGKGSSCPIIRDSAESDGCARPGHAVPRP